MRIPPPLYFVAAIVLAASLNALLPMPISLLPEGITSLAGNSLMVVAIIVAVLSQRELRRWKTGQLPGTSTSSLVTTGPYALSRNPIYLAWAIFQLGLGIWLRSAWIIILLLPAIITVNVAGIIPEERYLHDRFGQEYEHYRGRARRWL